MARKSKPGARFARQYPLLEAILCASLFAAPPMANLLGQDGATAKTELRELAGFPHPPHCWQECCCWPQGFESWLDDHFGARPQLIALNSLVRLAIGASGSPEVVVGTDGWLFLNRNREAMLRYRGIVTFSEQQLELWLEEYKKRSLWLEERGIKLVMVVIPEKQTVYGEHLPHGLNRLGPTPTDQLLAQFSEEDVGKVIDLRPILNSMKAQGTLYDKTNSHWNDTGCYIAYRAMIEELQRECPKMHLVPSENLNINTMSMSRDLVRLLGLQDVLSEDTRMLTVKHSAVTERHGERMQSTGIRTATRHKDAPAAFLLADSFVESYMIKYLQESFSRAIFTHHRSHLTLDTKLIEEYKPDLVIYAVVERCIPFELEPFDDLGHPAPLAGDSPQ